MVSWAVEFTDEFGEWWQELNEAAQDEIGATVELLTECGPDLPFPYSSGVSGSRHSHMRELRIQCGGKPIRIFYAFDPRRTAILLIGGEKIGDKRFYKRIIPAADRLYDEYIEELRKEGLIP
ncbi:MAG: type II toxin-antitoxin system RelE/ParE family toxin [Rhodomicrobium sp.]